jgi:predicted MPP superfamily phosphohydrolase
VILLGSWVVASLLIVVSSIRQLLPLWPAVTWFRGFGIAWGIAAIPIFVIGSMLRRVQAFDPGRRKVLQVAKTAAVAAPLAATVFGVSVGRRSFGVREVDVKFAGLPKDLDGLRIAQLTDIHVSPFLSERELERAVAMANETRPHLTVVTGDLVTGPDDPIDACLRALSKLRADSGIWACLGNHEIYAGVEDYSAIEGERRGIRFLRGEAVSLPFGAARLNIAGVDYQSKRNPYLTGAEKLVVRDDFNLLLSHNPDVFPVAAAQGFDLTLAGHTHGGQITVEILDSHITMARFLTPFIYGVYRRDNAAIYVSRGLGTVGVPARIGAPPEVSVIRLCAT